MYIYKFKDATPYTAENDKKFLEMLRDSNNNTRAMELEAYIAFCTRNFNQFYNGHLQENIGASKLVGKWISSGYVQKEAITTTDWQNHETVRRNSDSDKELSFY